MCARARTAYTLAPQKFWARDRKKGAGGEACCNLWCNTDLYSRSLTSAHLVASLFQTVLNSGTGEECGHSLGLQAVKVLDLPFHSPVVRMCYISKWVSPANPLLGGWKKEK